MAKTKTQAEAPAPIASATAVETQIETPEKQAGPMPAGRAVTSGLPPPNGIPPAARAADLLASAPGAPGAAGRARMTAAMQQTVGNAQVNRMLGVTPTRAAAPTTPTAPATPAAIGPRPSVTAPELIATGMTTAAPAAVELSAAPMTPPKAPAEAAPARESPAPQLMPPTTPPEISPQPLFPTAPVASQQVSAPPSEGKLGAVSATAAPTPTPMEPLPPMPAATVAMTVPGPEATSVSLPEATMEAAPAPVALEAPAEAAPVAPTPSSTAVAEAAPMAGEDREEKAPAAVAAGAATAQAPSAKPPEKPAGRPGTKAREGPVEGKGAAGGTEAPAVAPEAAAAPSPREAIAPAIGAVRQRAAGARKHPPASAPVASAQAAAKDPTTERTRTAAEQTVKTLDAAPAEEVRRNEFKANLKKAIDEATPRPKTESQAEELMETGAGKASQTLRGELTTQRDVAAGPLKSAAATEVPPSEQPAPPETKLQLEQVGPPPAPVSAAPVVPAPLPPERLDYSSDRAPTDQLMAENNISQEQLEKGNEPSFGATLEARATAETHEATAEMRYRQSESKVQDKAQVAAQQALTQGLSDMHGVRESQVGEVIGQQLGTKGKEATERQRISAEVKAIKDRTQAGVTAILNEMDSEATRVFEAGLKLAEKAYKDTFEEAKGGVGTWLTTWGEDWEELIEDALATAREEYLKQVDIAIDQVADLVEAKLAKAKQRVADGRKEVETFVQGLDDSVKQYGEEALQAVSADFDAMSSEIDQRRDGLIDKLAQQYKDSYERMSAMEEKLREENKSLWQRVYDATVGLVKKILAFKDMLLSVLGKAAAVIVDIITDPIGFLGNLVSGIMQGLQNFMGKIGAYLQKGIMDWLFGALAGAGLQLPEKFDLEGIVSIVLQILGLTYANFRARAVAIVGEPVVAALEQAAEVFKIVMTEGVSGLWRFIKEQLADLKSMVLDAIFDFIKERVIIAGITWIIGLLNPVSAFFKACKAIYDIVIFFINRGSQLLDLVNAVVDAIASIAKGAIGTATSLVEGALVKALPVAIGFLASLLGLGDPTKPVRETIEKARSPVEKAIDWVINLAIKGVKAAGKFIGGLFGGKKKDEKEKESKEDDPAKAAKVEAGLLAIDREEQAYLQDGRISLENAEKVAKKVKSDYPVFRSLEVVDAVETWNYRYEASPADDKTGEKKSKDEGVLTFNVLSSEPPGRTTVGRLEPAPSPYPTLFEREVQAELERETGLTAQRGGLDILTTEGVRGATPSAPILLEKPIITSPLEPTPRPGKKPIGSAEPDILLLTPEQIEVFEVTLDVNFTLRSEEKGVVYKRGTEPGGAPHKRMQIPKTIEILAQRFPGVPIVYNIQTTSDLPEHVRTQLEIELKTLRRKFAKEGVTNPVQIIWRS